MQGLTGSISPLPRSTVPGFDGLDGVFKRLFQNALADGPEHEAEQPSFEVLAVAYDDHVNVGHAVGTTREGVGVAGRASPRVGVGRREDDVVGIGPVVMQAFPDAARAFRDVGLRAAPVMHLEVLVGAVAKKLRAARPEVGEPGDVLLGSQGGCLVKVDRGHFRFSFYAREGCNHASDRKLLKGNRITSELRRILVKMTNDEQ